jgi:hypothetical protein
MSGDLSLREKEQLTPDLAEIKKKLEGTFEREYQRWYTEAWAFLRQILPDRLAEFEHLYKSDARRMSIDVTTYSIQDWLVGVRAAEDVYNGKLFDDFACMAMRLNTQSQILNAAEARFESSLFEIRQLVQADLFDHELDAARELLKNGFLRAAGAVSGVVLEAHLAEVCDNHKITVARKHPSIGDLNDMLKAHQPSTCPHGDLSNALLTYETFAITIENVSQPKTR